MHVVIAASHPAMTAYAAELAGQILPRGDQDRWPGLPYRLASPLHCRIVCAAMRVLSRRPKR
jgi:hypothetical protein